MCYLQGHNGETHTLLLYCYICQIPHLRAMVFAFGWNSEIEARTWPFLVVVHLLCRDCAPVVCLCPILVLLVLFGVNMWDVDLGVYSLCSGVTSSPFSSSESTKLIKSAPVPREPLFSDASGASSLSEKCVRYCSSVTVITYLFPFSSFVSSCHLSRDSFSPSFPVLGCESAVLNLFLGLSPPGQ